MHSGEELSNVFKDLHISVYSKAFSISSGRDLDVSSVPSENGKDDIENEEIMKNKVHTNEFDHEHEKSDFTSSITNFSTPKSKSLKMKVSDETSLNGKQLHMRKTSHAYKLSPLLPGAKTSESPYAPQKLLQLCDKQRCLTVEKVMMERIQNMHETEKIIHDNLEHLWQARQEEASARRLLLEQKILDDIHEQELKNRPRREAQLAEDNLKNAQRVLERIQRVKDAENEARKKSEALQLYRKLRDKIFDCQKEYGQQYKEIVTLINSCENMNQLAEKSGNVMKDLKNCAAEYDTLFKKGKSNEISEEDVNSFIKLIDTLRQLYKNLKQDIEAINLEAKKKQEVKEEEVVKEKVPEPEKVEVTKDSDQPDLSDCFDSQSVQTYLNLKTYLENFDKMCRNLTEDASMKKFRLNCQKAVTIPVNAISPISSAHLTDKYFKLYNLLSGKPVEVAGAQISASEHPEGIAFCKKVLAKIFVRQGDLTVSSKPHAAFSIAAVLASLWVDFPDFGQLTLAYFQNSCPYLAPVFMPQVEGQSVEDYHKSLGYRYTESGEVEKQDSFLKRMSGIMRLYAAVLISKVRQPGKQNPLGISEGWRWMSALLNLEPRPDICATLLFDFLEVAGNEMFKAYGAQFKKLLAYICQVYFPRLEKVTPASSGGPIVRLEEFLQKIMKNESIPPPEGLLPPNFW